MIPPPLKVSIKASIAYLSTNEMHDMNCDTFMITREMMIRNQGQEYYDNLVGDLTCTVEQAKKILKVI